MRFRSRSRICLSPTADSVFYYHHVFVADGRRSRYTRCGARVATHVFFTEEVKATAIATLITCPQVTCPQFANGASPWVYAPGSRYHCRLLFGCFLHFLASCSRWLLCIYLVPWGSCSRLLLGVAANGRLWRRRRWRHRRWRRRRRPRITGNTFSFTISRPRITGISVGERDTATSRRGNKVTVMATENNKDRTGRNLLEEPKQLDRGTNKKTISNKKWNSYQAYYYYYHFIDSEQGWDATNLKVQ